MIKVQNSTIAHKNISFPDNSHIINCIFSHLNAKNLTACLLVCKQWSEFANNEALWNNLVPEMAFGPREWKIHFGDIGEAPPLPRMIHQILNAPCPIWPEKRVHETHLLTLVPKTVNGKLLTLKSLGKLVKKPLPSHGTKYKTLILGQYTDQPTSSTHWTLLSCNIIPDSRNKSYPNQQQLVRQYPGYEVPNILDTTVAIFMEHVRSGNCLYSDNPWTFTRCQEKYNANWQLGVGGFALGGLDVYVSFNRERCGIGVQRLF